MNRDELALAEAVRSWIKAEVADDAGGTERAVAMALTAYEDGASAQEAFREARSFMGSWLRHPMNWRGGRATELSRAS